MQVEGTLSNVLDLETTGFRLEQKACTLISPGVLTKMAVH